MDIKLQGTIHIPTPREALGYWKAALLLAVLALTLVWPGPLSQFGSSNTQAATDGAAMSLRVDASQTVPCAGGPVAGVVCVPPGAKFDVIVTADAIPTASGYVLAQAWINWSGTGLTFKDSVTTWGDCNAANVGSNDAENANRSCLTELLPDDQFGSQIKGDLFSFSLTCTASVSTNTVELIGLNIAPAGTNGARFITFGTNVELPVQGSDIQVNCETPTSEIHITNVFQDPLPKTCFDVMDSGQTFLFSVCDNDFQGAPESHAACDDGIDTICNDEDPTEGIVTITLDNGTYHVEVGKTPLNITADTTKGECSGVKCALTFTNTSGARPWNPWDVAGAGGSWPPDGVIDLPNDILGVILHFCPVASDPCAKP